MKNFLLICLLIMPAVLFAGNASETKSPLHEHVKLVGTTLSLTKGNWALIEVNGTRYHIKEGNSLGNVKILKVERKNVTVEHPTIGGELILELPQTSEETKIQEMLEEYKKGRANQ